MPTLVTEKTVTARKAHRCMCCAAIAIQPGQTYHRETYVYDGRIYTWVSCVDCSAISGAVYDWDDPEEGVDEDSYYAWAQEHIDDPTHGEHARAYLARRGGA